MSKFTPGPWKMLPADTPTVTDRNVLSTLHVEDAVGGMVCRISNNGHYLCGDDDRANARLIAAAPAMYEALRNLTVVNECWCGPVGSRTCYRCEALVVLAEVEGR